MNSSKILCIFLALLIIEQSMVVPQPSQEENEYEAGEEDEEVEEEVEGETTTSLTTSTFTIKTTTPPKTRRKKTLRRKTRRTTTTLKPLISKAPYEFKDYSLYYWLLFLRKYQKYYCMKRWECTNDHIYFEREPEKDCARDYLTRELVWFDHKCSVWVTNCRGLGMFFRKKRILCERGNISRYIDEDYLDPPRTIKFAIKN